MPNQQYSFAVEASDASIVVHVYWNNCSKKVSILRALISRSRQSVNGRKKAEIRGVPLSSCLSFSFDSSIRREGSEVVKSRNMNSHLSDLAPDSVVLFDVDRKSSPLSNQMRLALEKFHPFLFAKLTKMMGVAQRALDCATKACGSAHLDFATYVAKERDKLDVLRDDFLVICREAKTGKDLTAIEKRLMEVVVTIFISLALTCEYSYDAASHMAALIGNRSSGNLNRMRQMSDCNNRALRLCMVTLVNGDAIHALNALRKIDALGGAVTEGEGKAMQDTEGSQSSWHELAIASCLDKISHNVRMVAVRLIDAEVAVTPARIMSPSRHNASGENREIIPGSAHGSRCSSMRLGASTHRCAPDREAMRNL